VREGRKEAGLAIVRGVEGKVEALLFDLGGVVITPDFDRAFARWAEHARTEPTVIKMRFSHDDAYRRHERGEIGAEEYFTNLRSTLGIDISDAEFIDGWNAAHIGEMPGISGLLVRAATEFPLYAFSNSNATHQSYWTNKFPDVLSNFKEIFVSSTIGMRKPEAKAFDYVVRAIGVPAPRIVFFDDVLENVTAARASQLQAVHVKTSADVANALGYS
jgi:glucose-1-phosphatase